MPGRNGGIMSPYLEAFLEEHMVSPASVDIEKVCSYKLSEMKTAVNGRKTSIAMLNSYCKPVASVPVNRKVAVIDAGGTNLRTCTVYFNEQLEPVLDDYANASMPGIDRKISAQEFFNTLADHVERLVNQVDTIGFCFSYAADITEDHDGVPFMMSKEIKVPDLIGKHLGKELFKVLASRGFNMEGKRIIVMNDTVTTLLAGLPYAEKTGCEGCVGFILGTGTNTACIGINGIYNEESANLNLRLGDIDKRFTDKTLDPGNHLLEKMVSGAYLGPLALEIIKAAAEERFFSPSCTQAIMQAETLTTEEMGNFILDKPSPIDLFVDTEDDQRNLMDILKAFVERAGKLTAANLAASVLFTDYGEKRPVLINADGSTFYKTPGLKEHIENYLRSFLAERGRKVRFTKIERSPIIGAAIGALSLESDVSE